MGNSRKRASFGGRLEWIRSVRLGMTQAELADHLSAKGFAIKPLSISRYEREERVPGVDFLRQLCDLSGVDGNWALTGQGGPDRLEGVEVAAFASSKEGAHGAVRALDYLVRHLAYFRSAVATEAGLDSDLQLAERLVELDQRISEQSTKPREDRKKGVR